MPFKPQSLSSPSRHVDKSLMFEGLDDVESGTFKPRKNFKKLVIPPHSPQPVSACLCLCLFVCVCLFVYACVLYVFVHVCLQLCI